MSKRWSITSVRSRFTKNWVIVRAWADSLHNIGSIQQARGDYEQALGIMTFT